MNIHPGKSFRTYVIIDGELVHWNEARMKTLDIKSNMYGEDVVTFEYNNKTYESRVISK